MTQAETADLRVTLLDLVHEQASEPVPDLDAVRELVDDFVARLEGQVAERQAE